MFDTANDRLNYTELLEPDVGYKLEFAVGMTYSLDLEALLSVPVSLGLLADNADELMKSPFYLLEAIRKSSDKIAVFCNGGSIAMPQNINSVYSLLENSVFEVKLPNKKNFHPKLWFIKYVNDLGEAYIKLIVLSRNLTFDKSIDFSVAMKGEVKSNISSKNQPLSDMLKEVVKYIKGDNYDKRNKILMLAEDILKVEAFETIHPFEDYEFLPLGIENYNKHNTKLFDKNTAVFIVSPFLSDDIIDEITNSSYDRALITRKSSITNNILEKLSLKNGLGVYVTKEVLTDNEYGIKQDIHAKLYFTATPHGSYLYIGSANASYNAFNNNIEFLLKLKIKHNTIGFKTIFKDWIPDEYSPFERIETLPIKEEKGNNDIIIDKVLKDAVYSLKSAQVIENNGVYDLVIATKKIEFELPVKIAPLHRKDLLNNLEHETIMNGLLLKELSEFYILTVKDKKIIVKISTKGIPVIERDNAIYKGIINTKNKFLMYISLMLSEDYPSTIAEFEHLNMNVSNDNLKQKIIIDGLYEKMLKVAHKNPKQLKEISNLIEKLDDEVVTEEFKAMYDKFSIAIRRKSK